jgi:hypothetical protein
MYCGVVVTDVEVQVALPRGVMYTWEQPYYVIIENIDLFMFDCSDSLHSRVLHDQGSQLYTPVA